MLIHDIVEVDAGDAPIHRASDMSALKARESAAAKRLFGLLPRDQGQRLHMLWSEFEDAEPPEARLAKALDRLQPLLLTILTNGGTWAENNVSEVHVYERYGPAIKRGSVRLWHQREFLSVGTSKS